MSRRVAARVAWSLWRIFVVLTVTSGILMFTDASARLAAGLGPEGTPGPILSGLFALVQAAFATVGALIVTRHPRNSIGWTFLATSLSFAVVGVAEGYAVHALFASPGQLPGGEVAAWLSSWLGGPVQFGLFVVLFLVFPDGRLLSRRWRPVAFLGAGVIGATALVGALKPGPLATIVTVSNPFTIDVLNPLLLLLEVPLFLVLLATVVASAVSLVLRFRRSRGEERQQIKWFASSAALLTAIFVLGPVIWSVPALAESQLWPVLFVTGVSTVPVTVGIAILRYRLYDIDVVINRTLVYGTLTVSLALVYFGGVALGQWALRTLTGGESSLTVVASTLAIAALFQPLRRRIQTVIDRRLYRRKYDASRTLQAFSVRLRDETDLSRLSEELQAAVQETMQPAHVFLWLRGMDGVHYEKR